MSECVFCDIAAGEAPAEIINSNGFSMTLVPLNPVTPGHVIVIPRKHVKDALSDPQVTGLVMHSAALMGQRMRKFHPEYRSVNIITSVGALATQTVFHLHIHVVPRREGDGLQLPWSHSTVRECERLYPEVGHEDDGYSCSTHNMPWGECPEPTEPADTHV